MGRAPCCSKVGLHRGSWTADEDSLLFNYIQKYGEGHWRSLPKKAGLLRCGKSCRMRWMNYLRPDIKRGNITPEEDDLIIRLHSLLGNRWSLIARRLPGRTDNEIKNYWKSNLSKRLEYNTGTSEQRRTRESRNKTSTSTDVKRGSKRKQEKKKVAEDLANGRATEPKIHFPKAVKVSPLSDTTRNVGGSPSTVMNPSPSHEKVADTEASLLESAMGVAHNHGHDSSSQNHIPESDDYMLDDIFENYQQLLQDNDLAQLDFVDSVLA